MLLVLAIVVLIVIAKTAVVVPQQNAYVVERLGRYSGTLGAGFHVLLPFVDVIRYRHSLKEGAYDIPAQVCITRDNVQVGVDGVLYLKVLNAERASYGISDYLFAITQLAQTTLRSEIGKIDLDKTFEERTNINLSVVTELDKASEPWGVKVLRYEIKNITPPHDVLAAMEKQMRAEREKRAVILTSEGTRDAVINAAEGAKQETIKASEARKQQQINEAEGQAAAILAVATATAEGLRRVADAMRTEGGLEAVQLRVAEQYIAQFGELAKTTNTLILPANAADVGSMIALAMKVITGTAGGPPPPPPPRRGGGGRRPPVRFGGGGIQKPKLPPIVLRGPGWVSGETKDPPGGEGKEAFFSFFSILQGGHPRRARLGWRSGRRHPTKGDHDRDTDRATCPSPIRGERTARPPHRSREVRSRRQRDRHLLGRGAF